MLTRNFFFLVFLFCVIANLTTANSLDSLPADHKSSSQTALLFVENIGQVKTLDGSPRPDVLFTLQAAGISIFIHQQGLSYQFSHNADWSREAAVSCSNKKIPTNLYRLDMQLLEASTTPAVVAEQQTAYFENHFNISQGEEAISKARSFKKVVVKDIYPNIDWVLYIQEGNLKYDFIIHPGGKISDIKMQYSGAQDLSLENDGSLSVQTPLGNLSEARPFSYQAAENEGNKKREVESSYQINEKHIVSFQSADYQYNIPLIVDPTVSWATYYGGGYFDSGTTLAIAENGDYYLAGSTKSANAISSGGHQNTFGGNTDAFLVKFDAQGNRLWATYFGGSRDEEVNKIILDEQGNVYMAGGTESNSQIAHNGFRETYSGNGDAFLVKFNAEGDRLWATYYGGEGFDSGHALAMDEHNSLYLTGITESTSGIASDGYQNSPGGSFDTFLAKFTTNGERLWATYFGGSGQENAKEGHKGTIAIDQNNDLYIAGWTSSAAGITSDGFQNTLAGSGDAYLAKFKGDGNLLWSTYYGGDKFDAGRGVAIDKNNQVYMAGTTSSTSGIASGGFQETIGGNYDAFLVKFNAEGERIWATYYGGSGQDEAKEGSLCIDDEGNIYMGGFTDSNDGIAACGFQNTLGGSHDAFVVRFDATGDRHWGSYFGGKGFDISFGSTLDGKGNLYMTGWTSSAEEIASGGFQDIYGGSGDAFLVKIDPSIELLEVPELTVAGQMPLCPEESIDLSGPLLEGISYEWRRGKDLLSSTDNTIRVAEAGKYTLTILNACDTATSDTVMVTSFAAEQAPEIIADGPTTFCPGGSVKLSMPEEEHISYQWQHNAQPVGDDSYEFTATESGLYSCIITNECGSLSAEDIEIRVEPEPSAPLPAESGFVQCEPGRIALRVPADNAAEFRWYENATDTAAIPGETGPELLTPRLSSTKTYYVASINGNCESKRTAIEAIIQEPQEAYAGEDVNIRLGEQIQLQASGGGSYQWSPSQGLSDPGIPNPIARPKETTTYTLETTDANGCSATDEVIIRVSSGALVPNAFSPNHDGINDAWEIIHIEHYPNCTVEVFNRWGNKVFQSAGYKEAWDGTFRNKRVPAGSYSYFIQLDNENKPLTGSLFILY